MRRLAIVALLLASGCPREKKEETAPATTSSSKPAIVDAAPDVVSQASVPWEDAAPITVAGKVDGAALRAKNRARLEKDRSPVTVLRGDEPFELGKRICEAVVPERPASTPVLLKPNLGGFDWFKDPGKSGGDDGVKGRITNPEFVRGVIRCLKARGHTKITVAEGWGATHKDWLRLIDVSGYAVMTKEEGVPLVAMDDDGVFDQAEGQPGKPLAVTGMEKTSVPTLLMPKILAEHLEHGLFISLPKVKAHRFGVVSLSVKGVQGTIMLSDAAPAFRQKWRMHRELNKWLDARKKDPSSDDRALYVSALETFAERIATVLEVEAPDVVLADGAPGMSGDGFQKLYPSSERVAIGGTNPVRVDRVGAQFLGLWKNAALAKELGGHTTSPLIESAAKRFGIDLDDVTIAGDGASLFDKPRPAKFVGMAPFTIEGTTSAAPSTVPTAHASPLGAAKITLDGRADEPAWKSAKAVSWSTDWSGADAGIGTKARFLWSDHVLYALFEVAHTDFNVDTDKPVAVERTRLYVEDCIELFLDTTPASPKSYWEIEVGPFGHFFDLAIDGKKSDLDWSAGLKIGTTRDEQAHTAILELAITSPDVTKSFAPNARFPFALYRMEGKSPRKYLAWSPTRTKTPNFHVPEAFGALVLDP